MKVWEFLNFLRVTYVCIGTSRGTLGNPGESPLLQKKLLFCPWRKKQFRSKTTFNKKYRDFRQKLFYKPNQSRLLINQVKYYFRRQFRFCEDGGQRHSLVRFQGVWLTEESESAVFCSPLHGVWLTAGSESLVSGSLRGQILWCLAHCGVGICGVWRTAGSDSAVFGSPHSPNPWCPANREGQILWCLAHRGVRIRGVQLTGRVRFRGVWLTAGSDSMVFGSCGVRF